MKAGRVWSMPALQVLGLLASGEAMHGYAIAQRLGIKPDTTYKILSRLEQDGLLVSETERVSHLAPRVAKVVYSGTTCAFDALQDIRQIVGCTI